MRKLRHEEIARTDPDDALAPPRHPVVVVADNIRSIYNVGAFFRNADAFYIEHLYLTGYTGTPAHRALAKTALGAEETVPWSHHRDPFPIARSLQDQGYTLAALELTDRPTSFAALTTEDFPLALVLGNEVTGVRDEWFERVELALEIPQYGSKQSLNVSVACGVALHALVEHYRALCLTPHD